MYLCMYKKKKGNTIKTHNDENEKLLFNYTNGFISCFFKAKNDGGNFFF